MGGEYPEKSYPESIHAHQQARHDLRHADQQARPAGFRWIIFPDPVFLGENDPSLFILIDPKLAFSRVAKPPETTNKKTPLAKGERGQSQ